MGDVTVASEGALKVVRLTRPAKKNALTSAMYATLADAMEAAESDPAVRAVVILGAPGAFCAGNDIKDFLAQGGHQAGGDPRERPVIRFLLSLARSSVPVIAGVDGVAIGIGLTMLLHCDGVLVTPQSRLQAPFLDLAIVPEAASTLLLPQRVGYLRAAEILMLGRPLDGETAISLGIAGRVVEPDALERETFALAERFAAKAPGAMRDTKRLMRGDTRVMEEVIMAEADIFTGRLSSPEAREVFAAFLEKRQPDFSKLAG